MQIIKVAPLQEIVKNDTELRQNSAYLSAKYLKLRNKVMKQEERFKASKCLSTHARVQEDHFRGIEYQSNKGCIHSQIRISSRSLLRLPVFGKTTNENK